MGVITFLITISSFFQKKTSENLVIIFGCSEIRPATTLYFSRCSRVFSYSGIVKNVTKNVMEDEISVWILVGRIFENGDFCI